MIHIHKTHRRAAQLSSCEKVCESVSVPSLVLCVCVYVCVITVQVLISVERKSLLSPKTLQDQLGQLKKGTITKLYA